MDTTHPLSLLQARVGRGSGDEKKNDSAPATTGRDREGAFLLEGLPLRGVGSGRTELDRMQ